MNSELFRDYLSNCFERLQKSLEGYPVNCDNENLFRFRGSIKKIRTCIYCIEFHKGDRLNHIRKELKKFFQQGGHLRELKLNRDWLSRHHYKRLINRIGIDQQILTAHERFVNSIETISGSLDRIRHKLKKHEEKTGPAEVLTFYVFLVREELLKPLRKLSTGKWHYWRKHIKRVLYARHWQEGKGLRLISKGQAKFLDRLQHSLGDWHDTLVMADWVKTLPQERTDPSVKKLLGELRQKVSGFEIKVRSGLKRLDTELEPMLKRLEKFDK